MLFLMSYPVFFYLSAETPIRLSNGFSLVELLCLVVFLSLVLSGFLSIILKIFRKKELVKYIEKACVFIILFIGFLLVIENWSYSLFKFGLKTEVTWWSKLLFILLASFLSYQFMQAFIFIGNKINQHNKLKIFLIIPALAFILIYCFRFSSPLEDKFITDGELNPLNVLILISDGVNAAEMSVYGSQSDTTPFLKTVASEFMIFENAYTNNENSTGSVMSILTGLSPITTKVVYPPDILSDTHSKLLLPVNLEKYGYKRSLWGVPFYVDANSQGIVGAFDHNIDRTKRKKNRFSKFLILSKVISESNLSSIEKWFLINMGNHYKGVFFDSFFIKELENPFDQVSEKKQFVRKIGTNDRKRVSNIIEDIENASNLDVPFFSVAHLMKTHGSKFRPTSRLFSHKKMQDKPWMIEFYKDVIVDFDTKIKMIYNKLKATNQLNNTIFIITSDHGMKWSNKNRVPLLIRLPNAKKSGRYNVNVQLLDITPTIYQALNLRVPFGLDGKSLLHTDQIPPDRYILSVGVRKKQVVNGLHHRADKNFISGNKFSVLHCDVFMRSSFPINFSPQPLTDRHGDSGCSQENVESIKLNAKKIITKKILN